MSLISNSGSAVSDSGSLIYGKIPQAVVDGTSVIDDGGFPPITGFPWFDLYNEPPTLDAWPWSDFGGAPTFQSTDVGMTPFTARWVKNQSGGGIKSDSINGSGSYESSIDNASAVTAEWFQLLNNASIADEPFRIESEVRIPSDATGGGNHSQTIIIGFNIGFAGQAMHLYLNRSLGTGLPPAGIDTPGDTWGITTNKRIGAANFFESHASGIDPTVWMKLTVEYDGVNTVTFSWDNGTVSGSTTANVSGDIINPELQPGAQGTSGAQIMEFRNTVLYRYDKTNSFLNYYEPNLTRWFGSNSGDFRALVNAGSKTLQQIGSGVGFSFIDNNMPDISVDANTTYLFRTEFVDLSLSAGVIAGVETISRKLTYADGNVYDYGFRNNAGTIEFFVDKNASNEYSETLALPATATITVERDATDAQIKLDAVSKYTYDDNDSDITGFQCRIESSEAATVDMYEESEEDYIEVDGDPYATP